MESNKGVIELLNSIGKMTTPKCNKKDKVNREDKIFTCFSIIAYVIRKERSNFS